MSRKLIGWVTATTILLASTFFVPDAVAQRGGKGGGGKGGGQAGGGGRGGGGGQGASARGGGRQNAGASGRVTTNRGSGPSASANARVARGPANVRSNIAAPNARVGVGVGVGRGFYRGGFYGGWYGRGGFYSPWRFGFFGAPGYWGGGYRPYSAPYYTYYPYDASQPVAVTAETAETTAQEPTDEVAIDSSSGDFLRDAQAAFREGNYDEAVRLAHHAVVDSPQDGKLHLFTAQTLFAVGDYEGAAAAIHQGASLLPESEWGAVVEDYKNYYHGRDFVAQMEQLDSFIAENPDAGFAFFVRGYEHGFLGHQEMAVRDFKKAVELEPRDELATHFIQRFGGAPPEAESAPASAPAPEETR